MRKLLIIALVLVILLLWVYDLTHLNRLEVALLSLKGENITWSDFLWLKGKEVGSGLYIMEYPIDDSYCLWVSDGDYPYWYRLFSNPLSVKMVNRADGSGVYLDDAVFWEILFGIKK